VVMKSFLFGSYSSRHAEGCDLKFLSDTRVVAFGNLGRLGFVNRSKFAVHIAMFKKTQAGPCSAPQIQRYR
jgi:hypothetical protein